MAWKLSCVPAHHQDAYNEMVGVTATSKNINYDVIDDAGTILSQAIAITETCVVVAVGTLMRDASAAVTDFELEQPKGTVVVDQEDETASSAVSLFHYASWRLLPPGTYTYFLVNRAGGARGIYAAQLKLVAVEV